MLDKQREAWLSQILNELPDRLFVLDQSGRFIEGFGGTFHSVRLEKSGYTNRTLHDLLPHDKADQLFSYIQTVTASAKPLIVQYSVSPIECLHFSINELDNLKGRDEMWFEATIKPLCIVDGAQYVLWQERDITSTYHRQEELKRLSETDELTGIFNRRAFLEALESELTSSKDTQHGLSCLMIDIDHFKEINDQVGHLSGDEVITHVAKICQQQIRGSDYIGRLGGEEFGVVLSNINAIKAYDIAERIRQSIESTPCHVDEHIIHPTVSIGIAESTPDIQSVKQLLIQADKAMYYSKQTGRNQVTLYHSSLPDMKVQSATQARIRQAG
ncbi:GGDEF domain-containing protein [Vibrio sp. Isolate25]|uniref:sensor domain-containing diguanylate cyclase n=1 Tax=Vibrio sp. Isolate25 TaxID=2908535 RepID=UPI001EFEDABE|nr:sensor domain-containing diguanylate cyclase [Vibrio sp. Isolate25]MCG9597885.1 GGDEF domain-containing protein [Vibrio sp. Isolate25]